MKNILHENMRIKKYINSNTTGKILNVYKNNIFHM